MLLYLKHSPEQKKKEVCAWQGSLQRVSQDQYNGVQMCERVQHSDPAGREESRAEMQVLQSEYLAPDPASVPLLPYL